MGLLDIDDKTRSVRNPFLGDTFQSGEPCKFAIVFIETFASPNSSLKLLLICVRVFLFVCLISPSFVAVVKEPQFHVRFNSGGRAPGVPPYTCFTALNWGVPSSPFPQTEHRSYQYVSARLISGAKFNIGPKPPMPKAIYGFIFAQICTIGQSPHGVSWLQIIEQLC